MKIRTTTLLLGTLAAGSVSAQVFVDDFQRATTSGQTSASSPNAIGTEYTITSGEWSISDASTSGRIPNQLVSTVDGFMYYNGFQTLRDAVAGESFSLSADVWAGGYETGTSGARRQGLVFNFQDENNYLTADFLVSSAGNGTFRLVRWLSGVRTIITQDTSVNIDRLTYYTIEVSTDGTGEITAEIFNTSGGAALASLSNNPSGFTDGFAGFYKNSSAGAAYDNFSLTTVPEPGFAAALLGLASLALVVARRRR